MRVFGRPFESRRRMWIILVSTMAAIGLAACASTRGGASVTPAKGSGSTRPASTVRIPAGSTPSFADGFRTRTQLCKDLGWPSCLAQASSAGAAASGWCAQEASAPASYGGPSSSDITAQWIAGCDAALGIASSTTNPTPSTTTPPVAQPRTSTTALSPADQSFVSSVQNQIVGPAALPAWYFHANYSDLATPEAIVASGQAVCAVAKSYSDFTQNVALFDMILSQSINNSVSSVSVPDGPNNAGPLEFIALAFTDLCPTYADLIPPGTPT